MTDTFIAFGICDFYLVVQHRYRHSFEPHVANSHHHELGHFFFAGNRCIGGFGPHRQSNRCHGAYCAFTCALLAWGWNELSFFTGWITGPQKTAILKSTTGWPRFVASFNAVVWHELAILMVGLAIVAITWDAPNQVGTGTYLVLVDHAHQCQVEPVFWCPQFE
jgi:putative photosynthetic complex assembly protein 2